MNRTDTYEKYKITKASTNKVVCNVYLDSFGIEKVRFQNASYEDKTSIECYLDFEEVALLAADAQTGRLIKQLDEKPKTISIGGTKSSKNYDGAPESRIMSLGKSGEKIFINMTRGKGKIGDKGQIMPDGSPDLKISVGMDVDKFRSMFVYTNNCVNAYLAHFITRLYKECAADREKFNNANK